MKICFYQCLILTNNQSRLVLLWGPSVSRHSPSSLSKALGPYGWPVVRAWKAASTGARGPIAGAPAQAGL